MGKNIIKPILVGAVLVSALNLTYWLNRYQGAISDTREVVKSVMSNSSDYDYDKSLERIAEKSMKHIDLFFERTDKRIDTLISEPSVHNAYMAYHTAFVGKDTLLGIYMVHPYHTNVEPVQRLADQLSYLVEGLEMVDGKPTKQERFVEMYIDKTRRVESLCHDWINQKYLSESVRKQLMPD